MFRVYEIKNKNRRGKQAKRIEAIPPERLLDPLAAERTVPYYALVPEQFRKHREYQELKWEHKGLFRILCDELWRNGGKIPNIDLLTPQRIGVPNDEWVSAKGLFIKIGLLAIVNNEAELMQPELREQYVQFIVAHSS